MNLKTSNAVTDVTSAINDLVQAKEDKIALAGTISEMLDLLAEETDIKKAIRDIKYRLWSEVPEHTHNRYLPLCADRKAS